MSMRICNRALDFFQIYDCDGRTRICCWTRDCYIGKITENSVYELYHGEAANHIRNRHIADDYSLCKKDACPYLATGEIDKHKVTINDIPEYPRSIYIGFEQVCNYACRSCTIHNTMIKNRNRNLEENYRIIEERIKEALPYVKHISANGCGELFVSEHTLNLLSSWEPKAPIEECSVTLESNGSLFDEEHWKRIESLSIYHLRVNITVMSFEEDIYQYLSGTKLPISRIENNLRFIKNLRQKGIVNYFEIATVVQEQNFRTMPEFVRRCIYEFGADYVRLRPYEWWGECPKDEAWFKDIRNPHHSLYQEYKSVMAAEIMKNPKVHDWSGGMDSEWAGVSPFLLENVKLTIVTELSVEHQSVCMKVDEMLGGRKEIIIYGWSNIGKVLATILVNYGINVSKIIDRASGGVIWKDIPVVRLDNEMDYDKDVPVIITPVEDRKSIGKTLIERGYKTVIQLGEILNTDTIKDALRRID